MSSTHVVNDSERKACIFANGEMCSMDLIKQILAWEPFIVALDGAANRVSELAIKIDALIGDFDSVGNLEQIQVDQDPIALVYSEDQNSTDLEKGLQYLIEAGYSSIDILWATGKRMDHALANLFAIRKFASHQNQIRIIDDHSLSINIQGSNGRPYRKWHQKGDILSLIPFPEARNVQTENLKYPLNKENLALHQRIGSSNEVAKDGMVEIRIEAGFLFIIQSIEYPSNQVTRNLVS